MSTANNVFEIRYHSPFGLLPPYSVKIKINLSFDHKKMQKFQRFLLCWSIVGIPYNFYTCTRFKALITMKLKTAFFWDVTSCGSYIDIKFRRHLQPPFSVR